MSITSLEIRIYQKNYNKIFAILIDYVNPIAGAILIATCVYVLYKIYKGDKIHL